MGFEIPKTKKAGRPALSLGSKMTFGVASPVNASSMVHIVFGHLLIKRLGWMAGDRINVLYGNGSDFGRCRVERCTDGHVTLRPNASKNAGLNSAQMVSSCRFPEGAKREYQPRTEVAYEIRGNAVEFILPTTFCFHTREAAE